MAVRQHRQQRERHSARGVCQPGPDGQAGVARRARSRETGPVRPRMRLMLKLDSNQKKLCLQIYIDIKY